MPGSDVIPMYKKYLIYIYKLDQNIVCIYCDCISHDITEFEIILQFYDSSHHLRISEDVNISLISHVALIFLIRIAFLSTSVGSYQDKYIYLCRLCHNQLSKDRSVLRNACEFPLNRIYF